MNTHSPILVHPGATLAENLEALQISQKDLAMRADLSEKHISQIINGSASVSPDTALRFERVLGIKASFWNNLEKNYRESLARIQQEELLKGEERHLKEFPCYSELANLGFVRKTNSKRERVQSLLGFFKVQSLSLAPLATGVNYRETGKKETVQSSHCLAAWIRCGQILADKISLGNFDEKNLRANLNQLKALTKERDFEAKLKELCLQSGIAVVLLPRFKGTKINGATFWFKDRPVIQLNEKGKRKDILWFTFFHEIGHILKHGKKNVCLELEEDTSQREDEADEFAENALIPKREYEDWLKTVNFNGMTPQGIEEEVTKFAKEVGVGNCIVAGRLAHNKNLHWSKVNALRERILFC